MTLQGRTIRGLIAGLIGGLAAWLLIDKTGWFSALLYNPGGLASGSHLYWLQAVLGGLYGLIVACALTIADWTAPEPLQQRVRSLVLSGLSGLIGGAVGILVGQWVYNHLLPAASSYAPGPTPRQMLTGLLARSAGWALIGLAIGAAQGIPRCSWRASRLGALGGFMGGLAGGGVFEAMEAVAINPDAARLAGFAFVGAATGFFLELVPVLMKQAWLRVESGRGAGKEYLLEKSWTSIGRSELADISLFGDPSIAPIHCLIEIGPSLYRVRPGPKSGKNLRASTTPAPLQVDGKVVSGDTPLVGGESIIVGQTTLRFHVRATTGAARPIRAVPELKAGMNGSASSVSVPKVPRAAYAEEPDRALTSSQAGHVAVQPRIAEDSLSGTKLVCGGGPYLGQTFPLAPRPSIIIGRAPDCEIPLASDKTISRRHAVIRLDSGRHLLEDLKSANGTYVNGGRLAPNHRVMLKPGDTVKLGDTILRYE